MAQCNVDYIRSRRENVIVDSLLRRKWSLVPDCRQRGTHVSLRAAIFPARQWTYSSFCRSTCPLQQVNTLSNGWAHYPLPSLAAASIPAAYREKENARGKGRRRETKGRRRKRERERKKESHKEKNDDPFPIDIMPSLLYPPLILPLVLFFSFLFLSLSRALFLLLWSSIFSANNADNDSHHRTSRRAVVFFSLSRGIFRALAKQGRRPFRLCRVR